MTFVVPDSSFPENRSGVKPSAVGNGITNEVNRAVEGEHPLFLGGPISGAVKTNLKEV